MLGNEISSEATVNAVAETISTILDSINSAWQSLVDYLSENNTSSKITFNEHEFHNFREIVDFFSGAPAVG